MNLYQALNAPYLHTLLAGTPEEIQLAKEVFQLSDNDVATLRHTLTLQKYHRDFAVDPTAAKYDDLRVGLAEYQHELFNEFWRLAGFTDTSKRLLDYGCGAGYLSELFLRDNPEGRAMLVDKSSVKVPQRADALCISFEETPSWYRDRNLQHSFDLVLLSEVLHCKDKAGQAYLVLSARELLKDDGLLIVVENHDKLMDWRLRKVTTGGKMLTKEDVLDVTLRNGFTLRRRYHLEQPHSVYIFSKSFTTLS